MKAYKKPTKADILAKTGIGNVWGFPIPSESVILTDLCALMEYRGREIVCALAVSLDGKREFAISFSALTRWGIEDALGDEESPRVGMFKGEEYSSLFGNQLKFRGCVLDVSEKQTLFVPKWDTDSKEWDFSILRKREYPAIVAKKATEGQLTTINKVVKAAIKDGWVSFYGDFK